ncbi:MAG TPA: SDR family oxidoreductase [Vicinamibacteria bacterium]|nr:SDR family oxidoreductase [Vicinamibacteria bacterium]
MATSPGRAKTARGRRKPARRPRETEAAAVDMSPARYIVKVERATGEPLSDPIDPADLLVHAHRDRHPVEIAAQFLASRLVQVTGNEGLVRRGLGLVEAVGSRVGRTVGELTGNPEDGRAVKRLLGVTARDYVYQFREPTHLTEKDLKTRVLDLQKEARAKLAALGKRPRLRVLLTGATGFLGKEILAQAATDPHVEEVVSVVRPETIRDRKTKEVVRVVSARERGAQLLKRMDVAGRAARKFRFVEGDVEKPGFGIDAAELERLESTLTHVVHCAASVSFDDTYENSFRSNVLGCRNALAFSKALQSAPGSPFVAHVAIETSYIHGRRKRSIAQEDALVFPRHFYNNYYELTKAMASIETDRALVQEGLRVTQLLPSIVIGHSKTGNNRGDTKVLNAPVNAFGRAKEALEALGGDWADRARAWLVGTIATTFPADRSAELNLVPVDRVVAGILASLTTPEAIGARVHLATDNRIRSEEVCRITEEELEVSVRMADPTLTRNLTLPLVKALLLALGEPKLAHVLERLGTIFGVYGEWGQPIHDVGNDVRLLGLSIRRPDTVASFRMLCRHNKYVQEFGQVRDLDEVARRERLWENAIDEIEFETGRQVASMRPREFRRLLGERVDPRTFKKR